MKRGKTLNKELFPQNVGTADRMLRFVLGEFLITFAFFWLEGGMVEYLLYIIGFILMFTAIVGNCFLYKVFGVDSHHTKHPVRDTLPLLLLFYAILIPILVFMLKEFVSWR